VNHPPVPPKNIWLSLPAMTPAEAEQILHLIDMLQMQLWEAYADAVLDTEADDPLDPPFADYGTDIP
jgi:hypothetical protein